MAISNSWLDNDLGLYRKFSEEISVVDLANDILELQQDVKFRALRYIIDDFTDVTKVEFGTQHTQPVVDFIRMRANTKAYLKIAIISRDTAESTATAKGFCEQLRDCHYQCQVFHTPADAKAWAVTSPNSNSQ